MYFSRGTSFLAETKDQDDNHYWCFPFDLDSSNEKARLGTFGSEVSLSLSLSTNYKHNTGMVLSLQRWKAMFVKKFLHSKRHKVSILFQLLLPLLFTLIALVNAKSFPKPTDSPPLVLVPDRFGSNVIPVRISGNTRYAWRVFI